MRPEVCAPATDGTKLDRNEGQGLSNEPSGILRSSMWGAEKSWSEVNELRIGMRILRSSLTRTSCFRDVPEELSYRTAPAPMANHK